MSCTKSIVVSSLISSLFLHKEADDEGSGGDSDVIPDDSKTGGESPSKTKTGSPKAGTSGNMLQHLWQGVEEFKFKGDAEIILLLM